MQIDYAHIAHVLLMVCWYQFNSSRHVISNAFLKIKYVLIENVLLLIHLKS